MAKRTSRRAKRAPAVAKPAAAPATKTAAHIWSRANAEDRLELVTAALNTLATAALIAVITARGLSFAWASSAKPMLLIAALLAIGLFFRTVWRLDWLSRLATAFGLQVWAGLVATTLIFATLGWQVPLIDAHLAAADRAIGFDTKGVIEWVAAHPGLAGFLGQAYSYPGTSITVVMALMTFVDRTDRVAEQGFIFSAGLIAASLCFLLFPAEGAFKFLSVSEATRAAFPGGAGVYHLPLFEAWRSGANTTIDFMALTGTITFPSFHMVMALMLTWSVRGVRMVFWPVAAFSAVVMAGVMPIGGHYAVDILGGTALFAGVAYLALVIGRVPAESRVARQQTTLRGYARA